MKQLTQELNKLIDSVKNESLSVEDIQRKLSLIILSNESLIDSEKMAKKLDNELEIIIYTLNAENQIEEALKVLQKAVKESEK